MTEVMDIKTLSPEAKRQLMLELAAEQKAEKEQRAREVESYKSMTDEAVAGLIPGLIELYEIQKKKVEETFQTFSALLDMKGKLYNVKEEQESHTFTHRDGSGSIRIGHNVIIGFDGTENAGMSKVREYIKTLASDDANRRVLTKITNTLMKPDSKGNLNPTRITELRNITNEINDPALTEGVEIILNAQFKTRTSMYVRGWKRVMQGEKEVKVEFGFTV